MAAHHFRDVRFIQCVGRRASATDSIVIVGDYAQSNNDDGNN